MLSKLLIAMGAFLMGLGGVYVGQRIDGDMIMPAMVALSIGII